TPTFGWPVATGSRRALSALTGLGGVEPGGQFAGHAADEGSALIGWQRALGIDLALQAGAGRPAGAVCLVFGGHVLRRASVGGDLGTESALLGGHDGASEGVPGTRYLGWPGWDERSGLVAV